jgi:hypothetical protein
MGPEILNLATGWRLVVGFALRQFLPPEEQPKVSTAEEARWARGSVVLA